VNVKRVFSFVVLGMLLAVPAVAAPAKITVTNAWVRALPGNAAGYFTLTNNGNTTIELVGIKTDACGMAMLHRSSTGGGMASMAMVHSISLAPHDTVKFEPGGYHVMCMDPTPAVKPGKTVTMTLQFTDKTENTVTFAVKNAAGR